MLVLFKFLPFLLGLGQQVVGSYISPNELFIPNKEEAEELESVVKENLELMKVLQQHIKDLITESEYVSTTISHVIVLIISGSLIHSAIHLYLLFRKTIKKHVSKRTGVYA